MVKIHGGIWTLLGIVIWAYTAFIEKYMVSGGKIPLFRWVALGFVIWGSIRVFIDLRRAKKRTSTAGPPKKIHNVMHNTKYNLQGSPYQSHQHIRHPHGSPYQTHNHIKPHMHNSLSHGIVRCGHCHNAVAVNAHFCPHCQAKRK